jgi:hypothetical protein
MELSDCPICLEELTSSEIIFSLPCRKCDFNYCNRCVDRFVQSSRDDYQVASDGSRQVKVHIACPQCRDKYPIDISKVLLLRSVHELGIQAFTKEGVALSDQNLRSTALALKRDLYSRKTKRSVELAYGLYLKITKGTRNMDVMGEAQKICQRIFKGLPEAAGESTDDEVDEYVDDPSSPRTPKLQVDDSLFQGLHDCLGWDEKVFLTDLFTSAEVSKLMQASMILNGVLKMSVEPRSQRPQVPNQNRMRTNSKKEIELLEKTKKSFPLAMHMPGYFIIPSFTIKQQYLSFEDQTWDGSITSPVQSARVFSHIYENEYHPPHTANPRPVVIIQAVRGPAGRVGLRRGDIITHINEVEWTGNAQELLQHIQNLREFHNEQNISITVNATPEVGTFLQIRKQMMERAKIMLI